MVKTLLAPEFGNLLDQCFPVPKGEHFLDDFPIWGLDDPKTITRRGYVLDGNIVSTAGLRTGVLNIRARGQVPLQLKVGIIGGVATHPDHRGQGFAKHVVTDVMDLAKTQDLEALFLWTGEPKLYESLGFQWIGRQMQLSLDELDFKDVDQQEIQDIKTFYGFRPDYFDLFVERSSGMKMQKDDLEWMAKHKNVEWLCAELQDGDLLRRAIIGFGRGIDLQGFIHEWAGDKVLCQLLMLTVKKKIEGAKILAHPDHIQDLGILMSPKLQKEVRFEPLCMVHASDAATRDLLKKNRGEIWFWGLNAC
jgi:N-acetylglutamate synthase-like GNAT family acetyltransferase